MQAISVRVTSRIVESSARIMKGFYIPLAAGAEYDDGQYHERSLRAAKGGAV